MLRLFVLTAMGIASPIMAQDTKPQDPVIVVTGTPLSETKAGLEACITRHCPPKEEIDAALAHAENQVIQGDYAGARRTLSKARHRNNRFAKELPIDVADLNRAYGRIANLNGQPDMGRLSQIVALSSLKQGVGSLDNRVLMQRIMVGDEFARVGRYRAAEDVYRRVEKEARRTSQYEVVGTAMFRDAALYATIASVLPEFDATAEDKIRRIERSKEEQLRPFRDATKILRANLAALNGDDERLSQVIADMPRRAAADPLLVYAPLINSTRIAARSGGSETPEWADLRFEIDRDGKVRQVEVLRDSGNVAGNWVDLAREAISGRRYAPLDLPPNEVAERVERYSYVNDVFFKSGSRLARRSGGGRLTSLDITADPKQAL